MRHDEAPDAQPPVGLSVALGACLATVGLAFVYALTASAMSRGIDLLAWSSGIFDMDVARVVADLATGQSAYRQSVHPLQKILVAPIGTAVNARFFGGDDPLAAARVLIAVAMALQTLAAAVLAWQLARRSLAAGVAAACIFGFSFSTWLAASIPESAAIASATTTLPLILLNARWQRPFTWWEAVVWGVLALLAAGLTITQLVHCAVALAVRSTLARKPAPAGAVALRELAARLALSLAICGVLAWVGLRLQAHFYPPRHAVLENPLSAEMHFMRAGHLAADPAAHVGGLLAHFLLFDFVAPLPGHSDFLIRDYGFDYWSLSVEEARLAHWRPSQLALAAVTLLAVIAAASGLRRADSRFLAPVVCVASQFAMHLCYGREYVLYSPHWHGALVAVLVAAAWRRFPERQRALLVAAALLGVLLLRNDVTVMRVVYDEFAAGLGTQVRDAAGVLR
jgi:hypothetical protein